MSRFVFACEPAWRDRLADELRRVFPHSHHGGAAIGWIESKIRGDELVETPSVALCDQCLPLAETMAAKSISEWGATATARIVEALADHHGPWRLHVFGVYHPAGDVGRRRCELIRENILGHLRNKQRRLLRSLTVDDRPWQPDEAFAQIGLTTPVNGYFSHCDAKSRFKSRRLIAPFCGGIAEIQPDKNAPARAFAKLIEAETRLGRKIERGQTCVDLGSSPGSWAYLAVHRGANVEAIDRSPLRADLMANPAVQFIRGDAFEHHPAQPVDWLLCDVIAPPQRTIELSQMWISHRWCRRFCVTIKFRGVADYSLLEPLKAFLAGEGIEFTLRRLTNNKNEVTAAGELAAF